MSYPPNHIRNQFRTPTVLARSLELIPFKHDGINSGLQLLFWWLKGGRKKNLAPSTRVNHYLANALSTEKPAHKWQVARKFVLRLFR